MFRVQFPTHQMPRGHCTDAMSAQPDVALIRVCVFFHQAVGKEADMPSIVERLNTEVHNLQLLLRRKSEQADAAERRYNDMEQRLLPLVDRRRAGGGRGSEPPCDARKQNQVADPLKAALEKEQQHSAVCPCSSYVDWEV